MPLVRTTRLRPWIGASVTCNSWSVTTGPDKTNAPTSAVRICRMPSGQRTSASVSAVLPAYNEEAIIERTVRHVAGVLRGLSSDFEVIVTNDGSRDRTGEILA